MAVAKVEPAPTGEDIIRAIKLKVYQRHYETIFNEAIQARLAVIDAPPEKLEGLKARQVALEELASGLEEDIRQLSAPEHSGVIKARPATGTGAIRYEGSSGRSAEPGSVRRRLEEAHDQLEKLRTDFTDKHPEVIGQLGRIQALEAQFAREVEAIRAEELRLNEGGTSPAPVDPRRYGCPGGNTRFRYYGGSRWFRCSDWNDEHSCGAEAEVICLAILWARALLPASGVFTFATGRGRKLEWKVLAGPREKPEAS
jgi:hypothetical protein